MKIHKLAQLILTFGERFLVGDCLSWGLLIGTSDTNDKDFCEKESVKEEKTGFETHTRAWAKSIVWRLLGIVILGGISWIITHSWKEMSMITILFHSVRVVLYYFHERTWEKIHWGRINHPLSVLPVRKALNPEDLNIVRNQLQKMGYLD